MNSKQAVVQALKRLSADRGKKVDQGLIEIWIFALSDLSVERIKNATTKCLQEHISSFLPSVAEFRTFAVDPTRIAKIKQKKTQDRFREDEKLKISSSSKSAQKARQNFFEKLKA